MSANSRLRATKVIGQRKSFYRQRIPESTCARKETVDINVLVTARNGDRKIMQSIRITCRLLSRIRKWNQPVQPVQLNTYQSNTYGRLKLATFQQSCISVFVTYLTISSSNQEHQPRHDNSIPYMAVWQSNRIQSSLRREKLHRTNQGSSFLVGSFNNRDNVRAPIQFRRESQPKHLKR